MTVRVAEITSFLLRVKTRLKKTKYKERDELFYKFPKKGWQRQTCFEQST